MDNCMQVGTISGLQHDVDNLVGWQKSQNGAIHRVEEKVDKLIFWQMTAAAGFVVSILLGVIAVTIK